MTERKVTHEIRLDRSIRVLLWAFAVGFILHALPAGKMIPDALAELSGNPTITLIFKEDGLSSNFDIDS